MSRKRMGRPHKKLNEMRTEQLHVNLTREEKRSILKAVKASGKYQSEWAREILMEAIRTAIVPEGRELVAAGQ